MLGIYLLGCSSSDLDQRNNSVCRISWLHSHVSFDKNVSEMHTEKADFHPYRLTRRATRPQPLLLVEHLQVMERVYKPYALGLSSEAINSANN